MLDLVFSTTTKLIQAWHIIPGISDHNTILFEVHVVSKFHKRKYESLRAKLSSLHNYYLTSNPEERPVENNWSTSILEAINTFIPSKMSRSKHNFPWISPAIERFMNKHDHLYNKTKRTGKIQHLSAYTQLCISITKCIRESHAKYVEDIMGSIVPSTDGSAKASIKRVWSYIQLLCFESMGIQALSGIIV